MKKSRKSVSSSYKNKNIKVIYNYGLQISQ